MKQFRAALLCFCVLLFGHPALAEHKIYLQGIVNVPGAQVAFLQIDKTDWTVHTGEHCKGGPPSAPFELNVLDVDLTNEIVRVRIDDNDLTNSLPAGNRPPSAKSWIHLQDANFWLAMDLCGKLSGRTVLLHPGVDHAPFSCDASWTDSAPDKTTIADRFSNSLKQRNVASLEDGDCFLQIVPDGLAQSATLGAKDLAASESIQHGVIDFEGAEMRQVMNIYAKLLDREQKRGDIIPRAPIYLRTNNSLSKAQFIYALETLFRWNGAKIVLNDDKTFSVVKFPAAAK